MVIPGYSQSLTSAQRPAPRGVPRISDEPRVVMHRRAQRVQRRDRIGEEHIRSSTGTRNRSIGVLGAFEAREGFSRLPADSSLLEWDPAHFRLFVGNLAGEVTDDTLHKAFSRWPSVQKARVIRDKRTTKSKGYGFVSFSDGDEFFQACEGEDNFKFPCQSPHQGR